MQGGKITTKILREVGKEGGGGTITEKFPGREGEGGIAASLYYVTLPRISLI